MVLIIGGLAVAAAIVTFGAVSWNDKLETTSQSAKEKIETVKKTNPELTGDAPLNSKDSENGGTADAESDSDAPVSSDGGTGQGISGKFGDGGAGQGTSGNTGGGGTQNSDSGESAASPGLGTAPSLPGTTLAEIKSAYYETFSELEVLENSKIDQVVVQAKADYVSGKYSKEDLAVKYQETALALEAQSDRAFQAIYQQLEYDLEKYGHDTSEAVVYRNEYERKKSERLSHMINQFSKF